LELQLREEITMFQEKDVTYLSLHQCSLGSYVTCSLVAQGLGFSGTCYCASSPAFQQKQKCMMKRVSGSWKTVMQSISGAEIWKACKCCNKKDLTPP